jgi:hypothetical protein
VGEGVPAPATTSDHSSRRMRRGTIIPVPARRTRRTRKSTCGSQITGPAHAAHHLCWGRVLTSRWTAVQASKCPRAMMS